MPKSKDLLKNLVGELFVATLPVLERAAESAAESVLDDVREFGKRIDRQAGDVQDRLRKGARRRRQPERDPRDEE